MERLTTVLKGDVYYAKGKWPPTTLCAEMEVWEIRDCMTRLAQYEDTGLSPEQVLELKERIVPQEAVGEEGYPNCPKCGTGLIGEYCYECGQKVDWS